jgi:hypothetical protein
MPFLPVLLTWATTRMNCPNETKNISYLLMNILESLVNLLVRENHGSHPVIASILEWSAELFSLNLRLSWNYDRYRQETRSKASVMSESVLTAINYRPGSELVQLFCTIFELLGGQVIIDRWGEEALNWALYSQVYRARSPEREREKWKKGEGRREKGQLSKRPNVN